MPKYRQGILKKLEINRNALKVYGAQALVFQMYERIWVHNNLKDKYIHTGLYTNK